MKKAILLLLCALLLVSVSAFAETDGYTVEELTVLTDPEVILGTNGALRLDYRIEDANGTSNGDYILVYLRKEDITYFNQGLMYDDGTELSVYYSDDPADGKVYIEYTSGGRTENYAEDSALETAASALENSVFGFEYYDCAIESVTSDEDGVTVGLALYYDGVFAARSIVFIDNESGLVTYAEMRNYDGDELLSVTYVTFTYDPDTVTIDFGPLENYLAQAEALEQAAEAGLAVMDTFDIYGNRVTYEDICGADLIMINYWEPWCSPCVRELPDLERLFKTYSEEGLLILGVYSQTGMDDDILSIMEDAGITYPVIAICDALMPYTTDYVPTTVFANAEGHVISEEPVIGGNTYEEYEKLVLGYLEAVK